MQPINLTVDSQVLSTQADQVRSAASEIESRLSSVTTQIKNLEGSWRGASSDKFQQMWADWQTSASNLLDAMSGIGDFLSQAASTYEETERQIASGMGN